MFLKVERDWGNRSVNIWLGDYRGRQTFVAKPIQLVFEPHQEDAILPEPTLRLDEDLARVLLPELKKSLAGFTLFDDKEEYETAKRVEKAMQAHIDSLKLVVERTIK